MDCRTFPGYPLRVRGWIWVITAFLLVSAGTEAASMHRCGTCAGGEIRAIRPDSLESWSDSPHFRVHYTTSGPAALPCEPESLNHILEVAYTHYHDTLGLPVPPGDGEAGGGWNLTDCYVTRLPAYEGVAWSEYPDSLTNEDCPCQRSGAFIISVRNAARERVRTLTAHEYFHVVQYGLCAGGSWFMESTAVWAERQVWPEDQGLFGDTSCWFHTPFRPLFSWGLAYCRMYGAVHYWLFLEDLLGSSFVPDVLSRTCQLSSSSALREELAARGSSFDDALVTFAIWNNCTGSRDDGLHYRLGAELPEIAAQAEHASLPVQEQSVPELVLLEPTGSNYIRFLGPGSRDTLHIHVNGDASRRDNRRVSLVALRPPLTYTDTTLVPDASGDVDLSVAGWSSCGEAMLIVTDLESAEGTAAYTYSAWERGVGERPRLLSCGPNPSPREVRIEYLVPTDQAWKRVTVFDPLGRMVQILSGEAVTPGRYTAVWDADVRAMSGVYFIRLQTPCGSDGRKVVIAR